MKKVLYPTHAVDPTDGGDHIIDGCTFFELTAQGNDAVHRVNIYRMRTEPCAPEYLTAHLVDQSPVIRYRARRPGKLVRNSTNTTAQVGDLLPSRVLKLPDRAPHGRN